jgi:hypothetical protein
VASVAINVTGRASQDGRLPRGLPVLALGRAPQEDLVMLDKLRMPVGTLSRVI